jgi:hypothetical protein
VLLRNDHGRHSPGLELLDAHVHDQQHLHRSLHDLPIRLLRGAVMKTNHLLLKLTATVFTIGSGAALVVACSSSSNPGPAQTPSPDGSTSSSSGGSGSGGGSSSSGSGSSSSSSGGSSCVPDGGDAATCNSCAKSFCAPDASGCTQDPYNACTNVTTCIPFTGTLPSPFPKFM